MPDSKQMFRKSSEDTLDFFFLLSLEDIFYNVQTTKYKKEDHDLSYHLIIGTSHIDHVRNTMTDDI